MNGEIDYEKIRQIVQEVLSEELLLKEAEIELGEKWQGGEIILKPKELNIKPKHIPMEIFFHKIVMLRDRMRVLEQKINSNKKLTDEEKIDIQQYITRIYGSLTTFNLLFKRKSSYFVGEGNLA
ncbi:MAG: hypothetical protein ABIF11_01900 [Nitrospirota bacterium]